MGKLDRYSKYLKTDLSGWNFYAYSIPDFFAEQSLGYGCRYGHFPGFQISFRFRNNMVFHDRITAGVFDLYTVQDLNFAGIDLRFIEDPGIH